MAEQPDPDGGDDTPEPADGEPSAVDADADAETAASDAESTPSDAETHASDADSAASDADDVASDAAAANDGDPSAAADGGTGSSVGTNAPTIPEDSDPQVIDDGLDREGPESDEEMPLADHIEEMMRRLAAVFLIAGIALAITYPFSPELINYLWATHIPEPMANRPRLYGPLEFILTKLKVAGLSGLVVGLPMFVYQTYRFMKPGLYPKERRYYLAAVPTSLILGIIGVLFAHFLVLPFVFAYFTTYTAEAAVIAFGLQETFNLILIMMGWMAIIFQIPLFIMLAIMMNLVTRLWLESKRLLFWGAFLGIAFIFSPDPTGMAPIIVTLTMVALFEGTLALLRWTGN
ncbi:preprotein translocase subunit TatC [Halonotius terrestris]|uniref:Sec-independent protein translocase protein TatC n=1 Tax=Halonotius terrestris TaxID=2487750 RepID=A0A8J8P8Y1_9EURY|nr:twin-arginine translocase subunit TatC [Halonotius terrestris]TQQ79919.1 preprotein translocase subunit TatC [Halonotius terrestris]